MDIIKGEKFKKVLRILLKLGYSRLKTDLEAMGKDLDYSQNPVIRNLNTILKIGAHHLDHNDNTTWQTRHVLGYGQGFLWAITKDTAYRDVFFWMLDKVLEHPEELKKMLEPYVKPPEEWIPNLWQDSKDKTREAKKKGKIPANAKSLEESIFTPAIQNKRHQRYLKKK